MKTLINYKIIFLLLFILNILISIFSFIIFERISNSKASIEAVYKNIYTIELEKNTELTDLNILTKRTCFNKCDLLLEKDISKLFENLLFFLRKEIKYDYDIINPQNANSFTSSFSDKLIIHQHVCLDISDCKQYMDKLFNNVLEKYSEYLNNHLNELIYITNYIKNSNIYNLDVETSSEFKNKVSTLASQIITNSTTGITEQEAINMAFRTIESIETTNYVDKNAKYYAILFKELSNFKENRLSKIISSYKLNFIEKRIWSGGLKESPYRAMYYKIPNLLKSIIIFLFLLLSTFFLIRIYNSLKNKKDY